jgi:L,D-transpeptidase YcbB
LKNFFNIPVLIVTLFFSCGSNQKETLPNKTDSAEFTVSIEIEDAFSDIQLDSVVLESFLKEHNIESSRAEDIRQFYQSRDYQFAWFTKEGPAQHTQAFWNLHNNFLDYSQDSSFFNNKLHKTMELLLDEEETVLGAEEISLVELQLTDHFFDYAQYAFEGKINAKELKWHIPRKKVAPITLLDSLIARNGENIDEWEPLNQQYKLVRNELYRLYSIQKNGGWNAIIPGEQKVLRPGDSSEVVSQLKQRLRISGDLSDPDNSERFSTALETAVKRFQKRTGLQKDGVVGPATIKELNIPVRDRIKQVLVNMERMRWMPKHGEGKRLVANIPEFKLHVFEGNKHVFDMKIVVGKSAHKTVVFNDKLEHVVFSPYWNIPRSIVRNEILPSIERNPQYLQANNMEQTGSSGGLPVIRQKPGPGNALGKVKFIFPNRYSIYFHDTPAKSLFERNRRAFSHGCIRLAEPMKLAKYLLQDKTGWTDAKISSAMNSGKEQWVRSNSVDVVISYFTAWVDNDGVLNFREDIYGHDKELAERLFED